MTIDASRRFDGSLTDTGTAMIQGCSLINELLDYQNEQRREPSTSESD